MKAVVALLFIVVLLLIFLFVVTQVQRIWNNHKREHARWDIDERSDGEQVALYLVKPDEEDLLIGAVPFAAIDFDNRLYELRSSARLKLLALNDRKELKR